MAQVATAPRPNDARTERARVRWIAKPIVWLLCLIPAALLVLGFFENGLGANPIEKITHETGRAALLLLIVTLCVTPLRRITGMNWLVQLRRLIGLFAFFYALLHFATYLVLDQFFAWNVIVEDILERPYITVGFLALLMLAALAVTSTKASIRRLGRNWQRLHWLIYPAAALGVLHFYWKESSKADVSDPLAYGAALLAVLLVRVPLYLRQQRKRRAVRAAVPSD